LIALAGVAVTWRDRRPLSGVIIAEASNAELEQTIEILKAATSFFMWQ
jgi:hypothetical protein